MKLFCNKPGEDPCKPRLPLWNLNLVVDQMLVRVWIPQNDRHTAKTIRSKVIPQFAGPFETVKNAYELVANRRGIYCVFFGVN